MTWPPRRRAMCSRITATRATCAGSRSPATSLRRSARSRRSPAARSPRRCSGARRPAPPRRARARRCGWRRSPRRPTRISTSRSRWACGARTANCARNSTSFWCAARPTSTGSSRRIRFLVRRESSREAPGRFRARVAAAARGVRARGAPLRCAGEQPDADRNSRSPFDEPARARAERQGALRAESRQPVRRDRLRGEPGQAPLPLVQLQRLPLDGRRRHRPRADGRQVEVRRRSGEHLPVDHAGPSRRPAFVRRPHPRRPGVADRRLRAGDERPAAQGRRAQPRRHALPPQSVERAAERVAEAMTPMMSLFLRCLLAVAHNNVLMSVTNFAFAATPIDTVHDALHAMGPQAKHFADLWNVFLAACTVVFIVIVVAVWLAIRRAPRALDTTPPDLSTVNRLEPGPKRHVTVAEAISGLALVALIVASVFTARALARLDLGNAVHIEVTGHQWWWTARYLDGVDTHSIFATANEIH